MDLYKTLGVSKSASVEDIKKAHRKLSVKWHPDSYKGSDEKSAIKEFKQIQDAYETLSDPTKKMRYDAFGHTETKSRTQPKPKPKPKPQTPQSKGKSAAGPKPESRRYEKTENVTEGLNYVYVERTNMGRSIQMQVKLTPELAKGGFHQIKVKKKQYCERCIGDGEITVQCPVCLGKRPEINWCQTCDGIGGVRRECRLCKGEGLNDYYFDEVSVNIPARCPSGHMMQVIGGGESGGNGRKPPGNLQIVFV